MKKLAAIFVLIALSFSTYTTFAQSKIENFGVNGFYHEIVNGDDFLSLSFNWKFTGNEIPAKKIVVSVNNEGDWKPITTLLTREGGFIILDDEILAKQNSRMGHLFTDQITYSIKDLKGSDMTVEEFFNNPSVEIRTEVFYSLESKEGERVVKTFPFKRPKCKCIVEDGERIVSNGSVFRTNVSAVHENKNANVSFSLAPLNGDILKRWMNHKYPTGITLDSKTGEITYQATENGEYAFMVIATDEENNESYNVVTFEVSSTASVDYDSNSKLVYPNPTSQILNITDKIKIGNIQIIDINGNILKSFDGLDKQLNVSDLPVGSYFLINNEQLQQFIIER